MKIPSLGGHPYKRIDPTRGLMTDFQNIKFEKKNQIAYITIDRPKVLNALNMATMQELKDAFASIKDDAEVRVAILTGAGEKAFVAGADIGELSQQTPVSAKEYTHRGQAIVDAIENLGKPVIALRSGFVAFIWLGIFSHDASTLPPYVARSR